MPTIVSLKILSILNLYLYLSYILALAWMIPHFICISPAFIFYAYICHGFFVTFIPMTGRFGNTVNPEFIIGGFAAGTGLLTGSLMVCS